MIFERTYQNDFNMEFPGDNFFSFLSFNLFVQEISRKISKIKIVCLAIIFSSVLTTTSNTLNIPTGI